MIMLIKLGWIKEPESAREVLIDFQEQDWLYSILVTVGEDATSVSSMLSQCTK